MSQRFFYTTAGVLVGMAIGYYLGRPRTKRKKRRGIIFTRNESTDSDEIGSALSFEKCKSFEKCNGKQYSSDALEDKRVDFLTGIVSQLWDNINPAASSTIRRKLEPMLKQYFPSGPMKGTKVVKVDLGSAPLLLDHVMVHEINRKDGFVQFDMDVVWDGRCQMDFSSKIGKFGIKALKLKGRMSFLLKPLTNELPCFSAISYAFINQPQLEMSFTGLASVAEFSYIDGTVKRIVNDALASMMVLPYRMIYKMDENASLLDIYQPPHGIARLTLESGRGFYVERKAISQNDIPDVYCKISFADTPVRTPTIRNSLRPVWDYSMDFMVCDMDQTFSLAAWDEDNATLDADDDLGICYVTLRELLLSKDRRMELLLRDKDTGSATGATLRIKCDLLPLLSVENATIPENLPTNELVGVLAILVRQAFDIPLPLEEAMTMVKVKAGENEFATSVVKAAPGIDALNPLYDCVFHVPITAQKPDVTFSLIQGSDKVLGAHTVSFNQLLTSPVIHKQQEMGEAGAKLEFSVRLLTEAEPTSPDSTHLPNTAPRLRATFSSVNRTAASHDNIEMAREIPLSERRKVRVTAVRGTGFKIRRRFINEVIPDVYLKVRFGNNAPWQTSTIHHTTTPTWDESKVFAFVSNSEIIQIEAWDQNSRSIARHYLYGLASVSVNKILLDGGTSDLELESNGIKLGVVITISATLLD